jgi:hypothetical protein
MINKYYVFAGQDYYPCGGAGDFIKIFDDIHEAIKFINNLMTYTIYCDMIKNDKYKNGVPFDYYEWAHIANDEMKIILEYRVNSDFENKWEQIIK